MPTVADYAVLQDGSFELNASETFETTPFFRPEGFVEGTKFAKAILAFKALPLPVSTPTATFAPSVDLAISKSGVPDTEIYSVHLDTGTTHGLWETFPATKFGRNIGTIFRFHVTTGRVRISDVILWYQIRVAAG